MLEARPAPAVSIAAAGAVRLRVREAEARERDVRFRLPFRFGAATVHGAPQAFVRVRVEGADGRSAWGHAAELLMPRWFDKDPARRPEDNVDQLRFSIALAAEAVLAGGLATPFALAVAAAAAVRPVASARGVPALAAGLGPALFERAVADAACRLLGVPFAYALRAGALGFPADLGPFADLRGRDLAPFLSSRRIAPTMEVRHTVGLADAVRRADADDGGPDAVVGDGLPESLEEAIEVWGLRRFKVKVAGAGPADRARLCEIAALLDEQAGDYTVTLDGNECFPDVEAALALAAVLGEDPHLASFARRVLYLEQPLPRARALDTDVRLLAGCFPVLVDESDDADDAFVRARAAGYAGVSVKGCKGLHRAVANAARAALWNAEAGGASRWFVSAEDLTTQAGLALQQDLALASALGCTHAERNGHWYVGGMAGAPAAEQARFAAVHPDLYELGPGGLRLRVAGGRISLASLEGPGFASGALPDFAAMTPMRVDCEARP
jgi:hypothetical protein